MIEINKDSISCMWEYFLSRTVYFNLISCGIKKNQILPKRDGGYE